MCIGIDNLSCMESARYEARCLSLDVVYLKCEDRGEGTTRSPQRLNKSISPAKMEVLPVTLLRVLLPEGNVPNPEP